MNVTYAYLAVFSIMAGAMTLLLWAWLGIFAVMLWTVASVWFGGMAVLAAKPDGGEGAP